MTRSAASVASCAFGPTPAERTTRLTGNVPVTRVVPEAVAA